MISILPVKYPSYMDLVMERSPEYTVYNLFDSNPKKVQATIKHWLYEREYNYCLVLLNSKDLYICETTDVEQQSYSTRKIEYHPLFEHFNKCNETIP